MTKQLLHRADIIVGFEEVRSERMTKGVRRDMFIDTRCLRCAPDSFL